MVTPGDKVNKIADPFDDLFLCDHVLLGISYWTSRLNPKCLSQLLRTSARNWCILRLFFCDWGGFADSIGDMARVTPYFRVFEMNQWIFKRLLKPILMEKGMPILIPAIVTGSSCGIGHAIAIHLHSLGARVVLNYASSSTKAGLLVSELNASASLSQPQAIAVRADVSDPDQVKLLFDRAEQEFGSIRILVNCAGCLIPSTQLWPIQLWRIGI